MTCLDNQPLIAVAAKRVAEGARDAAPAAQNAVFRRMRPGAIAFSEAAQRGESRRCPVGETPALSFRLTRSVLDA